SLSISQTEIQFINLNIDIVGTGPLSFNVSNCNWKIKHNESVCDDNDPCTINDMVDINCNCIGQYVDSDNDTVCDELDQCPGYPDHFDANNNGVPDGCENVLFSCDGDSVRFCEYLERLALCDNKLQPIPIISLQDTLLQYLVSGSFDLPHFNIPELVNDLMSGADSDGDGIFDILDPCPEDYNYPDQNGLYCVSNFSYNGHNYYSDFEACCDENIDKAKASLLAYFLFNPGTEILENPVNSGNIIYYPLCASE